MVFNPDRINIHELTIEDPEAQSELPFDPERDISAEDWAGMQDWLKTHCDDDNALMVHAVAMEIVFPGRTNDADVAKRIWKYGIERLKNDKKDGGAWSDFCTCAYDMKILFPDKSREFGLDEEAWQGVKHELNECRKYKLWESFFKRAEAIKALFPEKVDEICLDEEALNGIVEVTRKLDVNDIVGVAYKAMHIKMVSPESMGKIAFSQKDWQGLFDWLEKQRSVKIWFSFASQAAAMKILAAEEVKLTGNGLEINMRKPKLDSGVPPVPETKKF